MYLPDKARYTYYEDIHASVGPSTGSGQGKFDFVMANPPFNVDRIDKDRLAKDPRFPFGLPRTDNGNYLWIQIFYSALNATGCAGFVMANSASDARGSELEIRKQPIQSGAVDASGIKVLVLDLSRQHWIFLQHLKPVALPQAFPCNRAQVDPCVGRTWTSPRRCSGGNR